MTNVQKLAVVAIVATLTPVTFVAGCTELSGWVERTRAADRAALDGYWDANSYACDSGRAWFADHNDRCECNGRDYYHNDNGWHRDRPKALSSDCRNRYNRHISRDLHKWYEQNDPDNRIRRHNLYDPYNR